MALNALFRRRQRGEMTRRRDVGDVGKDAVRVQRTIGSHRSVALSLRFL